LAHCAAPPGLRFLAGRIPSADGVGYDVASLRDSGLNSIAQYEKSRLARQQSLLGYLNGLVNLVKVVDGE